jgi:SAM-dependent methyltransferase
VKLPVPRFLRQRTTLKVLHYLRDDWAYRRRFARGDLCTTSGTILQGKAVEESVRYIEQEFRDYLEYGRTPPETLSGKRILVVGPGDNLGVALLFLAHGARYVANLDKFAPPWDLEHLVRVYRALRGRLPEAARERFDEALEIRSDRECIYRPGRSAYLTGSGLEDCGSRFPAENFDLIVSRAVLEHLYDPDRAFDTMDKLLAPGGRMAHKIDLRDHDMFSAGGKHPLTFLTFPGWLWRRMTLHSGKPNRRLYPYYALKMRELGYEHTLFVTHIFGEEGDLVPHPPALRPGTDYCDAHLQLVRRIRGRLDREFRSYTDEELLISGIFLSSRKPSPGERPATSSNKRS